MKKFESNGFVAKVTNDKVSWEIPISNLINAFNLSPENYSEDGENFITVKRGKRKEFAEYVAKMLMEEADQETGASYIEEALDKVFSEVYEGDEEFAKYPMFDD